MVLIAESALKRIYPGWRIPYVEWHRARRVDDEYDEPYFDIPQHAITVRVSQLRPDEVVDIAALTAERDEARRELGTLRALSMLQPREMNYQDRSEFERLKRADVEQGRRIAELLAERDALKAECERLKLDQWPCPRCGPSEQDPLRSQLAALREALRRACDGWEGCWTSDNNDPPPDEIAELRKLAEES